MVTLILDVANGLDSLLRNRLHSHPLTPNNNTLAVIEGSATLIAPQVKKARTILENRKQAARRVNPYRSPTLLPNEGEPDHASGN